MKLNLWWTWINKVAQLVYSAYYFKDFVHRVGVNAGFPLLHIDNVQEPKRMYNGNIDSSRDFPVN